MALSAQLADEHARNHGGVGGRSTALAFCATNTDHGLLEVQAQGHSVAWLLGIWQTGSVLLGAGAE
jgi:hypothetical protein